MAESCGEQCAPVNVGQVVPLAQAVGLVLAHDVTEIVPGQSKGPAFRKGHVVTPDDLARLARMGKQHLYVLSVKPDEMHEDEAVLRLARALCGPGVEPRLPPSEGKLKLIASRDGLFEVDPEGLLAFNLVPDVMCATIHRHTVVRKGQALGGVRPIPLIIGKAQVEQACAIGGAGGGLLTVKTLAPLRAGVVVTGNEVASGLIEDRFAPVVSGKLAALGASVLDVRYCPDDRLTVSLAIQGLLAAGAEIIITTAGMSVDPDDVTRMAIADAGGRDLVYGAAVLPGAMFLVGLLAAGERQVPVLGVPACALFHPTTILDLVLPRVLAGERFDRAKIAALGHGGFCLDCRDGCRFPACGFGRGC